MDKVIVWGTGKSARNLLIEMDDTLNEVVAYADNDSAKWGTIFMGVKIISPQEISSYDYDKIVIASVSGAAIYKQLTEALGVATEKIETIRYFMKQRMLHFYHGQAEYQDEIGYLKSHEIDVFPYSFPEKCVTQDIPVYRDDDASLYYVMHYGKRMYMKRSMNSEEEVRSYYRFLLTEQDPVSPHRYIDCDDKIPVNGIIVDAGVAEGNFTLEIIDKIKKAYLIEMDPEWIEALQYTFREYQDKIVIIPKFLSDQSNEQEGTIDRLIPEKIDLLKMDIEGCEMKALLGAHSFLMQDNLQLLICTYHHEYDAEDISHYLEKYDIPYEFSKGVMIYYYNYCMTGQTPKFVKGLIRAGK